MALDAIRYTFEGAEVAYSRLYETLQYLGGGGEWASFAALYLDAWAMIDQGYRLRALLAAWRNPDGSCIVPDESHLQPLDGSVRAMRNHIQHLHERVDRFATSDPAAWGLLTWTTIRDDGTHAICWLAAGPPRPGIPFGDVRVQSDQFRSPVDHVVLRAYGDAVDLSDLYLVMKQLADQFDIATRQQFAGKPSQGSDFVFCVECLPDGRGGYQISGTTVSRQTV